MMDNKYDIITKWLPPYKNWTSEVAINRPDEHLDVICLCSGKTGGTSLYRSFASMGLNVLHVHSTPYFLKSVVKKSAPYEGFSIMDVVNYLNTKIDEPLLVVDVFREPLSRKISAFFQTLRRKHMITINELCGFSYTWQEFHDYYCDHIVELINIFNFHYLLAFENYYSYEFWRDDGLDITSNHFNAENKYSIIDHRDKRYLLLRFDNLSDWEEIIQSIGYENFKLQKGNISLDKDYSRLYQLFKSNYFIPDRVLLGLLDAKHGHRLHTFYTDAETAQIKQQWIKKTLPDLFNLKLNSGDYRSAIDELKLRYPRKI